MSKDPNAAAQKWATNLNNAQQAIQDGVNAVQKAPGMAAVAQAQVWLQNTQNSLAKWKANTGKVTVDEWKQAMLTKGVPRIGPGATAAQPKMAAFLQEFLPYVDRVVSGLPARGTLDQNITRMVNNARGIAQFKRS